MGVSKNSGTPKWMVYHGKPGINGWFGGKNPLFSGETSIYGMINCIYWPIGICHLHKIVLRMAKIKSPWDFCFTIPGLGGGLAFVCGTTCAQCSRHVPRQGTSRWKLPPEYHGRFFWISVRNHRNTWESRSWQLKYLFIFTPSWRRFPFWHVFFRWVGSTTN